MWYYIITERNYTNTDRKENTMVGKYRVECVFEDGFSFERTVCVAGKTERARMNGIQEIIHGLTPLEKPIEINVQLLDLREYE